MKKQILLILFSSLLLLACVPTPEEDAVKQKDTNVLIDTVLSEQTQVNADNLPASVNEQFPERFQCDTHTNIKNVHIVADVPLRVFSDSGFPLIRVERTGIDVKDQYEMLKRCFGTDQLYIWRERRLTKKEVAERIVTLLEWEATVEQRHKEWDGTEEDWEFLENQVHNELEELQEQFRTMTDDEEQAPFVKWAGSPCPAGEVYYIVADPYETGNTIPPYDLAVAHVETNQPYPSVEYSNMWRDTPVIETLKDISEGTKRIPKEEYHLKQNSATISAQDAIDKAMQIVDGFGTFDVIDVQWSNDADQDGDARGEVHHWFYTVRLSRVYEGACTTTCSMWCSNWEDDNAEEQQDYFIANWSDEVIRALVDRDGTLLGFDWRGKLNPTEVLAANTPLLSYDEITEILKAQVNRVFSWDDHQDGTLVIDDVQLGLMRIREKNNMESGLLVPVWYFTGAFVYADRYAEARLKEGLSEHQAHQQDYIDFPLLVINAIDGTIIDPMKGY